MNLSVSDWRRISQPYGACTIAKNLTDRIKNGLKSDQDDNLKIEKCTEFVFDSSISDTTIQSEWNVVCEDATLLNVIEMCFLAGAAIGSLSSGTLSDEYGRRHTLMIVVALQAIIGKLHYGHRKKCDKKSKLFEPVNRFNWHWNWNRNRFLVH